MKLIKAPGDLVDCYTADRVVFLAGSIEQDTAVRWQDAFAKRFEYLNDGLVILNPRRDAWDGSWINSTDNPNFVEQVNWELDGLRLADTVIFYFDPATKSPISLLELGLCAYRKDIRVVCPNGFWRKGNVEIVCERFKLKLYNSLDDIIL